MKIASLAFTAVVAAAAPAFAQAPAPAGTKVAVNLTMTYVETTEKEFDVSVRRATNKRTATATCTLETSGVMPYGLAGPSAAEEKAMSTPADGMIDLEREVQKCGSNQACLMKLMQKAAENPPSAEPSADSGQYQIWHPVSCAGEFNINNVLQRRDYEPAKGWVNSTETVKGQKKFDHVDDPGWEAVRFEHNLKTNRTAYWFAESAPVPMRREVIRDSGGN